MKSQAEFREGLEAFDTHGQILVVSDLISRMALEASNDGLDAQHIINANGMAQVLSRKKEFPLIGEEVHVETLSLIYQKDDRKLDTGMGGIEGRLAGFVYPALESKGGEPFSETYVVIDIESHDRPIWLYGNQLPTNDYKHKGRPVIVPVRSIISVEVGTDQDRAEGSEAELGELSIELKTRLDDTAQTKFNEWHIRNDAGRYIEAEDVAVSSFRERSRSSVLPKWVPMRFKTADSSKNGITTTGQAMLLVKSQQLEVGDATVLDEVQQVAKIGAEHHLLKGEGRPWALNSNMLFIFNGDGTLAQADVTYQPAFVGKEDDKLPEGPWFSYRADIPRSTSAVGIRAVRAGLQLLDQVGK